MSHVHAFPMHTYSLFNILAIFELFGAFLIISFFPLFLLFTLVVSMALSVNPLRPRTLFVLGHRLLLILLLLIFGFMMRMPERTFRKTFLDKVFIRNVESFWRTSLTLTYLMSFIVGVGSHYVTSWSHVHPC